MEKVIRDLFEEDIYSHAEKNPGNSLRKAINDKCKECIYDPLPGNGTWRQQVSECTSPRCPLFLVRPKPSVERGA
jgi:hypothetical protein